MSTDTKCEHCLNVNVHQGTTKGSVGTLDNYPCYISQYIPNDETSTTPAPSSTACIVLFTDVFGYELPNIRLLADKLALQSQLTVYVPDILLNDAIPADKFDRNTFPQWKSKHTDIETLPIIKQVLYTLRNTHNYQKIGGWGFCFGGRYAALAAANSFSTNQDTESTTNNTTSNSNNYHGLDAYAVAHPSFISLDDFAHLTVPGLYLCAETDMQFPLNLAKEVETTLVEKQKVPHVVFKYYNGTTHGFTVRGNENDPIVVAARDDALDNAAQFFHKVLQA